MISKIMLYITQFPTHECKNQLQIRVLLLQNPNEFSRSQNAKFLCGVFW